MKRAARKALLAVPAERPATSRLGGSPDLPAGFIWPDHLGRPLCFVAQLDLAEVRAADGPEWLPAHGLLYFFLALDEAPYGEQENAESTWRVLHHAAGTAVERREAPASVTAVWDERPVGFTATMSYPSLEWLGVEGADIDVSDHELDELADLPSSMLGDGAKHFVGGYPDELQDASLNLICSLAAAGLDPSADHSDEVMQRAWRNARGWRLLLQIDYDDKLRMRWPGSGRFYFMIRERYALKADFSKVRLLNQVS